jgi:AraC-like DNA-binding protein
MGYKHQIDWLFNSNNLSSEIDSPNHRLAFPYPPELATGYTEHVELNEGIVIVKDVHHFQNKGIPPEINLGTFKIELPSAIFFAHMMHSGQMNWTGGSELSSELSFSRVPGIDLIALQQNGSLTQTLFTKEDISSSVVQVPVRALQLLLGDEQAESFFENANISHSPHLAEKKIPKSISKKIENCTPDYLEGKNRILYGQSIVLQYLLELHLHLSSSKKSRVSVKKYSFSIEELHHELLQITDDIPSLQELSRKYNVSGAILNKEFFNKYDQTIYSFLSNQRLEQAYDALISSNIPMKTLAHKIGYSHVNHFITAFKKKFGKTPNSIRKNPE